jgi:hypothetical protein
MSAGMVALDWPVFKYVLRARLFSVTSWPSIATSKKS